MIRPEFITFWVLRSEESLCFVKDKICRKSAELNQVTFMCNVNEESKIAKKENIL